MNICKQHRCFLLFSLYPLLKASESLFRHHVDIECLDRIFDNPFTRKSKHFLANCSRLSQMDDKNIEMKGHKGHDPTKMQQN